MNQLDHIVIAAPDLEAAKKDFEKVTGVKPVNGGQHVGLGTRNALISFGTAQYLEIIAPDPGQELAGTFGGILVEMKEPQLLHFAIRVTDLPAIAERATSSGFRPGPIRRTSREQPDGTLLVWELLRIRGHELGGFMPFYIDWLACPHPADTTPVVGALREFTLTVPETVARFLDAPDKIDIQIGAPSLKMAFESDKGSVAYETSDLAGFRM